MKAINTAYNGHLFRSRLEAKWAIFFIQLGLKWEYEPEGFEFDGIRYLPDFRVLTPQGEPIWYEIKPAHVTSDAKFEAFGKALDADHPDGNVRRSLLSGDPLHMLQRANLCPRCGVIHKEEDLPWDRGHDHRDVRHLGPGRLEYGDGAWFTGSAVVYCYPCDTETPWDVFDDEEIGFKGIKTYQTRGHMEFSLKAWFAIERDELFPAARYARAARFEHGARP